MTTRHYILAIGALLAVAIALQVWRDRGWQPYEPATDVMWLQAGPAMERGVLGYDALVADVYWIRAVVYFGRQRLSKAANKTYDLLYPLLDLVTTLDPRFTVAYRFGAIFLSQEYPDGPHRPDLAIGLLQRAIERDFPRWEYLHDIAFVYFWNYRDYKKAAEWFDRASRMEGAPIWLKSMAATTLARGGDRQSSRLLWRQLYETAEISAIKENALVRLAQLDALDGIDVLNPIVWRYKGRTGHFPASWAELIAAGVLRRVPADPAGVPFVLDTVNEDVRISEKSPLWPLPEGLGPYAP